jgi:hypothetical protein
MLDVALLAFMEKILSRHYQDVEKQQLSILPAVHDMLEMDYSAIEAIVQRYGGGYLRCDGEKTTDKGVVAGSINSNIANYLTELCASRNMKIVFEEVDGRVIVTSQDYAQPTGSLPMVLQVLATLASSALDVPLVVLSYPLRDLDEGRAALLWESTLAPSLFPPPRLRTFVPIAGGEVDVARHCSRQEGGVRLVIREGELIERGDKPLLEDSLKMILRNLDDPLMLFLGAGASASCEIPQGNYLRDRALTYVTEKSLGSPDLIPEFRRWLTDHDRWMNDERDLTFEAFERTLTLERVLREEFFMLSGLPRERAVTVGRMREDCQRALDRQPEGRQALWNLPTLLPRLIIATVNFDQLIEDGMDFEHVVVVGREGFQNHRDLMLARLRGESVPVPILKLHGSIDDVNSLVVDFDTATRGLPNEVSDALNAIVREAGCLPWVWIGCSMRDADIGAWLAGKDGIHELQEWWVDPLPPRSVAAYARARRQGEWATIDQKLRDRQITETSDRFLSELVARAESLRSPV